MFGLLWYQKTFDVLVEKLDKLLLLLYGGGFVYSPVLMCWEADGPGGMGRRVLAPDQDALAYLEKHWLVNQDPDPNRCREFARLVGE